MATKYFDRDRKRIKKNEFNELEKLGSDYAIIRSCAVGDVKITMNWVGEFSTDVPDEYCKTYRIYMENQVAGLWQKEPTISANCFADEKLADMKFVQLVDSLKMLRKNYSKGIIEIDNRKVREEMPNIDLNDFGEMPISNNVPKTRSKNTGKW